jgi:hypothetical protein
MHVFASNHPPARSILAGASAVAQEPMANLICAAAAETVAAAEIVAAAAAAGVVFM